MFNNYIYKYFKKVLAFLGLKDYVRFIYGKLLQSYMGSSREVNLGDKSLVFRINTFEEALRLKNLVGEKKYIKKILNSIKPDSIFYDIGANIGVHSCFVAQEVTEGKVVAFEPHPPNFKALEKNVVFNNLKHIVDCRNIALFSENGTRKIEITGNTSGRGDQRIKSGTKDTNRAVLTYEVEVQRGDDFIKVQDIPPPNVMKIDVEGAELHVLQGFEKTLESINKPEIIFCEVHPESLLNNFNQFPREIEMLLKKYSYTVEVDENRGAQYFLLGKAT